MAAKTYDPGRVSVIIGGVPITGFAKGTFVRVEREEDSWSKMVGADGETARSRNRNTSGRITMTLMQTSASNAVLTAFCAADELSSAGVIPVMIQETIGGSTFVGAEGWIVKPANVEYGNDVGNCEWVVDVANFDLLNIGVTA